jgi:3',5'-cyclic AMP phosphodiesterase CpdA
MNTAPPRRQRPPLLLLLLLLLLLAAPAPLTAQPGPAPDPVAPPAAEEVVFSFAVTADMREFAGPRYQSSHYFLGACQALKRVGGGAFMVTPGDFSPPQQALTTIHKVLGEDYLWYPVPGNHETESPRAMQWLRRWGSGEIPHLVRRGPPGGESTTYSIEYANAHLVMLNQYYTRGSDAAGDGDITPLLFRWLEADLSATKQPFIFIFGHEPLLSIPDWDSGRQRHRGDNLDAHPGRIRHFQDLLRRHRVSAYICGHTHNFSAARINGFWQVDAGHARGSGDRGAPSTFLKILVGNEHCWVEAYRDDANGGPYRIAHRIRLD